MSGLDRIMKEGLDRAQFQGRLEAVIHILMMDEDIGPRVEEILSKAGYGMDNNPQWEKFKKSISMNTAAKR